MYYVKVGDTIGKRLEDEQIIACLLESGSKAETARKLKIDPKTLFKRMNGEVFKTKYKKAKEDVLERVGLKISSQMSAASDVLYNVMQNEKTAAQTRVNAATSILTYGLKFAELSDFVERLEALEKGGRS